MTNSSNSSSLNPILYSNCRDSWPLEICAMGNVFGLINALIYLFMYLPQIYRNFRHRSVQGLSSYWIMSNMTASIINLFFVFKWGHLPVFSKVTAIYAPIVQAILLAQIIVFTPISRSKIIAIIVCSLLWSTIILLEIFLNTYDGLQWICVTLWGFGPYNQVFLNVKRRSTLGLSFGMTCIRLVCTIFYFLCNYLLIMPIQQVILCYFGCTCAFILGVQTVMYWKLKPCPLKEREKQRMANEGTEDHLPNTWEMSSTSCNVAKICFLCFFVLTIMGFFLGLMWRTQTWLAILAPTIVVSIMFLVYCYYWTSHGEKLQKKFDDITSNLCLPPLISIKRTVKKI